MSHAARPGQGAPLRHLLSAIGEPILGSYPGPIGFDVPVTGLGILATDDEPRDYSGELVLIIGARGAEAVPFLKIAADRGASAVAIKVNEHESNESVKAAAHADIALLMIQPVARWEQLEVVVREVLNSAGFAARDDQTSGDLFTLAQTVAILTGGKVSIEDAGNRVLAYSRSNDDVDELRRLSILGWQGPETYLTALRDWGVFNRLRVSEEVVHIDEHQELGISARLAIGIRAGSQHLGIIWVQKGQNSFADRADRVLLGAARIAAAHLLRYRSERSSVIRSQQDLITDLLEGRVSPDLVAGRIDIDPQSTTAVVVFGSSKSEADHSARQLNRTEMINIVSVHATAHRRGALVTGIGSRVYAVLPDVASTVDSSLIMLAEDVVAALDNRIGANSAAAIGSPQPTLDQVRVSRTDADRVLDAMSRKQTSSVATITDLRAEVLLGETLTLLSERVDLHDPAVWKLDKYDAERGSALVLSLLAYLDALGDVRSAANTLHVHPNTLRYRVRRASEISGIDLDDPRERLLCHLQLVLATRLTSAAKTPAASTSQGR